MTDLLSIEWNIGNSCNLQCRYCATELKDGTNPFPNSEKLIPAFDHLIDQCRDFSRVQIEFIGGEPTSSPALQELILNQTNRNIQFKLRSNASPNIRWWSLIKESLYEITLTYHLSTEIDHFLNVVNLFKDKHLTVFVAVPASEWEQGLESYKLIKELHTHTFIQLLYKNFTKGNNLYEDYTQDQWDEYYKEQGLDISKQEQISQTIEFKRINNLNNFFGHLCWAGVEQIVIDNFGDVWRGWCKSNQSLGNIYKKTVSFYKGPIVCSKYQCKNGFDLQARKSEKSWGMI